MMAHLKCLRHRIVSAAYSAKRFQCTGVLYADPAAPPARFVAMTARHLGVHLHVKHVDLFANGNKTEEFTKINRLQKVPVFVTNEVTIRDSHAIALYLCHVTGDDKLYPNHPATRAKINEMLFFNSGTLFPTNSSILSNYFAGVTTPSPVLVDSWNKCLDHLEHYLALREWLCGDEMSLADFCCMSTISSAELLIPTDSARNPLTNEWMNKLKRLPAYGANVDGIQRLQDKIKNFAVNK